MKIALIDYRAGNLTSVRKALAAAGAEAFTPQAAGEIAGADGLIVPGVGHFEATAVLDGPWREAILAHARQRQAAPRHLPGTAVPVRRQHRGAGPPGAGVAARPMRQAGAGVGPGRRAHGRGLGRVQGAARRLERREPDAAVVDPGRRRAGGAGLLHALVRGADRRGDGGDDVDRAEHVRQRRRARRDLRPAVPPGEVRRRRPRHAPQFLQLRPKGFPRSPGASPGTSPGDAPGGSRTTRRSGSSRAWTSATDRSSRA